MKKTFTLSLLLSILSIITFGQGFPVKIDTSFYTKIGVEMRKDAIPAIDYSRKVLDRLTLLQQEGMPYSYSGKYAGVNPVGNTQVFGLIGNFGKHKVVVDYSGYIESTHQLEPYYSANSDPDGVYPTLVAYASVPANGVVPISFKTPLSALSASCFLIGGDGTTQVKCGTHMSGVMITNDLNFAAKRKIVWYGDSISDYTVDTGLTIDQYYGYIVRDWLMTNNPDNDDYRIVVRAIGGKTSSDFEKLRKSGRLYVDSPDIIFYQHGINDHAQAIGTSVAQANYTAFIDYKKRVWPNAVLIMLGCTPRENNTQNSGLAAYRNAMIAAVSAANDPLVKYVTLESSFDRTAVTGIWAASDGAAGDRLHPGTVTAQAGIANTIITGMQSFSIFDLLPKLFYINPYLIIALLLVFANYRNRRILFR